MPPQQQQNSDENAALWISALIILTIVIVWFTLHEWIVYYFLKLKLAEIDLFSPFTNHFNTLSSELRAFTPEQAKALNASVAAKVGSEVGEYLRIPLTIFLGIGAAMLYFGSVAARYRSTYDMQRLASEERVDWPQISPIIPLDLVNTPVTDGPWAMASNPMSFAKKYNLLIVEKEIPDSAQLSSEVKIKVSIKRLEAKQVFLMQLGNYWHNVESLPIHVKALFAMFAAKAHSDQNAVSKLNNQIAVSATKTQGKNIDFSGTEELLAKYINEKDVQQITKQHAFVYTVMASMLELARQDGVYASSDFLWLKPLDRRLWYTLNCVGRKTPFAEVAGIYAHRNAELIYHKPLYVPMVDEAVDALEIAISEILFKPSEEANS